MLTEFKIINYDIEHELLLSHRLKLIARDDDIYL